MRQVLEQFADSMAFRKGGAESIEKAIATKVVNTAEYSSGLQVSGMFSEVMTTKWAKKFISVAKVPLS